VAIASLAVAAASLATTGFVLLQRPAPATRAAVAVAPAVVAPTLTAAMPDAASAGAADVDADVAAALAKLNVTPHQVKLTSEKALRVRAAIKQGDYATASKICAEVLAASRVQAWDFQPFTSFLPAIADLNDPAYAAHLNDWVAQDGKDAMPLLVRARYYRDFAWFRRGGEFSDKVAADRMRDFNQLMHKALDDAEAALQIDGNNPYSYYLRLGILHAFGLSRDLAPAFLAAIAKYPAYYSLYSITLNTLVPKWGGTIEDMYDFVDHYAGQAPDRSPLKLLYFQLYGSLLDEAATACYREAQPDPCVRTYMGKVARPDLQGKIDTALRLYDQVDKYQFGAAIEQDMINMLWSTGGNFQAGTMLQLLAESMHSDAQLSEDKPGQKNDYMADKLVAASWYQKGYYDNAILKEKEALKDAAAMAFPGEEEKDLAIAGIYKELARIYDQAHLYVEMIAAEKASIALGGPNSLEHFICYGYYKLKSYDAARQACDAAIADDPNNITAYYWRGYSNEASDRKDAALQDLTVVAESENGFRENAAIEMSMIHFGRKDLTGALDLLNRYTYLYDPNVSSEDTVAVAYNNRCYAYMELGELKKALDDCQNSLKHGSIPDAYRKEQDLIKRLGPPGPKL
jgi:hypothetical protein